MKLTAKQIEAGLTENGGYHLAQLIALGYKPARPGLWPPKGWKERLTQREVTAEQYAEFLRLARADRLEVRGILRSLRPPKKKKLGSHPDLFSSH